MREHFIPLSLSEALEILNKHDCYILSGGTDLMVQKHVSSGLAPAFDKSVLYALNIKELDYIKADENKNIHVGAAVRYSELEKSPLIPEIYKEVIREIASPNIRNMATMTGNIGNSSPAGDSLVPLTLLDAEVVLSSVKGNRTMLVGDYIQGVRKTARNRNEMISEIILKPQELNYFWKKVGARKAESITKVSLLGAYKIENGIIKDFRVAFGSVSIKVVRNIEIENKYKNINVKDLDIEKVIKDYSPLVTPITDQRSNKEYRHKVAMNLLRKFLMEIKGEAHA